jgi:hypothetical protein
MMKIMLQLFYERNKQVNDESQKIALPMDSQQLFLTSVPYICFISQQ